MFLKRVKDKRLKNKFHIYDDRLSESDDSDDHSYIASDDSIRTCSNLESYMEDDLEKEQVIDHDYEKSFKDTLDGTSLMDNVYKNGTVVGHIDFGSVNLSWWMIFSTKDHFIRRIHVAKLVDGSSWAIKTLVGEHTICGRLEENPMATSTWLARNLVDELTANPDYQQIHFKNCGFLKVCRPIIGIDGSHWNGYYKGCLLTAIGIDGNKEIFVIAYSIVDTGVEASLREVFPLTTRKICCQHLYSNCRNARFDNAIDMDNNALTEYDRKMVEERLDTFSCGCRNVKALEFLINMHLGSYMTRGLTPMTFSSFFKGATYKLTFSDHIHPMPDSSQWPQFDLPLILPPPMKRAAGRPSKQRKRGRFNLERGKRSSSAKCGKCKEVGHNSRTCEEGLSVKQRKANTSQSSKPNTKAQSKGNKGKGKKGKSQVHVFKQLLLQF
ncbi:Interferon regulatory factor 2 [Bienertia sinuspersici]